jgi:hypothetical protein
MTTAREISGRGNQQYFNEKRPVNLRVARLASCSIPGDAGEYRPSPDMSDRSPVTAVSFAIRSVDVSRASRSRSAVIGCFHVVFTVLHNSPGSQNKKVVHELVPPQCPTLLEIAADAKHGRLRRVHCGLLTGEGSLGSGARQGLIGWREV